MVAKGLAAGKLVPLTHLSVDSGKAYYLVMNPSAANNRALVRLREWVLRECADGGGSSAWPRLGTLPRTVASRPVATSPRRPRCRTDRGRGQRPDPARGARPGHRPGQPQPVRHVRTELRPRHQFDLPGRNRLGPGLRFRPSDAIARLLRFPLSRAAGPSPEYVPFFRRQAGGLASRQRWTPAHNVSKLSIAQAHREPRTP